MGRSEIKVLMFPELPSTELSSVLDDPAVKEYGYKAYDSAEEDRSYDEQNALVVIPQHHGNRSSTLDFQSPMFADDFLKHHNQIRALASSVTGRQSRMFVEGLGTEDQLAFGYLASVYREECRRGIELMLRGASINILPIPCKGHLQSLSETVPDFEERLAYLNGGKRHVAWYACNCGPLNRVHGVEPPVAHDFLDALEDLDPLMAACMVAADLPALNHKRNASIVQQVRANLQELEIGVFVFGSGHVGMDDEPELAGELLQDVCERELPNTRLVILAPHMMPEHEM